MDKGEAQFNYDDITLDVMYLIEECTKLSQVVRVLKGSLHVLEDFPAILEDVKKIPGAAGLADFEMPNLTSASKIAKKEIDSEFQFLNAQFSLMLYAYLEATVKRMIKTFLKTNEHTEIKEIQDIQIKFSEYMKLDDSDRYEYLYQLYEKKNSIGMLYGLSRFEKLLAPIGLNGETPKLVSNVIFELSQVRNLIIHNGGIVDRHFSKNFPRLKTKTGEKFIISDSLTDEYLKAVNNYGTILSVRIGIKTNPELKSITIEDILQ